MCDNENGQIKIFLKSNNKFGVDNLPFRMEMDLRFVKNENIFFFSTPVSSILSMRAKDLRPAEMFLKSKSTPFSL